MGRQSFQSSSVADTEHIAAHHASQLQAGDCVALHGDLGAGKTQFVRGLVRGLGGDSQLVCSPTFVLLNVYAARLTVFHLDAYRVHGADDFEAIGFNELLEQTGIVVVEWPTRVPELLPAKTIHVTLEPTGETERRITIDRPGADTPADRAGNDG